MIIRYLFTLKQKNYQSLYYYLITNQSKSLNDTPKASLTLTSNSSKLKIDRAIYFGLA